MHGSLPPRVRTARWAPVVIVVGLLALRLAQFSGSPEIHVQRTPASVFPVRTIDGRANHPAHIGAAGNAFRRWVPRGTPGPSSRPDPRRVSDALLAYPDEVWTQPDPRGRSILFASFGQFLSHDISLRAKRERPSFVEVGPGDSMFPPGTRLPFAPNAAHPDTGEPYNRVTGWIDASMVYGSEQCRSLALRRFERGELRVSPGDQLPRYGRDHHRRISTPPASGFEGCEPELENENPRREPETDLFFAGDVRANENPVLLSLHTIFLREHNRRANELARRHPRWDDERLYQEARRWVGALVQAITFEEYVPRLLGVGVLPPHAGYRPDLASDPSVEFAAAGFRFGHSQMGPTLFRNAPNGERFQFSDVSLKAGYFATPLYEQAGGGPGAWLTGAAEFPAEPVDLAIVDDLRNYMFGGLRGGLDVATMNLAVGRESMAGTFNDLRRALRLPPVASFAELTDDPSLVGDLRRLYGSIDRVDPWAAMLAEGSAESMDRSVDGLTLRTLLAEELIRMRDGDRFYYENDPALRQEREEIASTRLRAVIRRNLRFPYRNAPFGAEAFLASNHTPRR